MAAVGAARATASPRTAERRRSRPAWTLRSAEPVGRDLEWVMGLRERDTPEVLWQRVDRNERPDKSNTGAAPVGSEVVEDRSGNTHFAGGVGSCRSRRGHH